MANYPAHEGHKPSLSLREEAACKVLICCHEPAPDQQQGGGTSGRAVSQANLVSGFRRRSISEFALGPVSASREKVARWLDAIVAMSGIEMRA
jgi:hypothetical protein